ncbi:hypothetical protein D3C77_672190 [compost metagenome]
MPLDLPFKAVHLLTPTAVRLDAGRGLDHRVQKPRHVAQLIVQRCITKRAPQRLGTFAAGDTQGWVLDKTRAPFKRLEHPGPHCRPDILPQCIERLAQRIRGNRPQCPVGIVVHHAKVWPPDHGTRER